jgi:hypothetical protein
METFHFFAKAGVEPVILTLLTREGGTWQNIVLVDKENDDYPYYYSDKIFTALLNKDAKTFPHLRQIKLN